MDLHRPLRRDTLLKQTVTIAKLHNQTDRFQGLHAESSLPINNHNGAAAYTIHNETVDLGPLGDTETEVCDDVQCSHQKEVCPEVKYSQGPNPHCVNHLSKSKQQIWAMEKPSIANTEETAKPPSEVIFNEHMHDSFPSSEVDDFGWGYGSLEVDDFGWRNGYQNKCS